MSDNEMIKPSTCVPLNQCEMEYDGGVSGEDKAMGITMIALGSLILTAGIGGGILQAVNLRRIAPLTANDVASCFLPGIFSCVGVAPIMGGVDVLKNGNC